MVWTVMLGYQSTTYVPEFNPPPTELIVPIAAVPELYIDEGGTHRTPIGTENLSSTDGESVNFLSASWQSGVWTFEPFTVVTWRVFRQLNVSMTINLGGKGGILVAMVTGQGGWVGGQVTLENPETKIYIGDSSASRALVNVWVV